MMEGKEEIEKVGRVLDKHVESGGKSHLPATRETAGFATPEQIRDLEMSTGERPNKPHGTDVLTIAPGKYEIANALNNPIDTDDATFIEYDISEDTTNGGRRQLWGIANVTGDIWFRTVHTGGDPSTGTGGWNQLGFLTPIWKGSTDSGTLKFNRELPYHKKGIEVFYTTISNQHGSKRIVHTSSGAIDVPNNPNTSTDMTFQNYELSFDYDKDGLTITSNNMRIINASGVHIVDTKGISITDVYAF